MSRPHRLSESVRELVREADVDPDRIEHNAVNAPPLAGRVKLAKGIEEGVDPPEELERGVLLKGRVHSVYAASGTGKTWFVLWLVKRCVERGEKVVVFDAENGQRIVSERLAALGVDTGRLDDLLHYYPFPNLTLDPEHVTSYQTLLDEVDPTLVIFDSLVNFLGSAGLEENSNDDIVKWATRYARPARERGVTVVVLDHVPHEGGHSRGASRKRDEVDVMWALKAPLPFDRDTVGQIVLHREKDREGWLGERVGFSVGGTKGGFVFSHSEGTIEEPDPADGLTASARKALDTLREDVGEGGATATQWHKATGLPTNTFYRARRALVAMGTVTKSANRYFVVPGPGDGGGGSSSTRIGTRETANYHLLPNHYYGSGGTEAQTTTVTTTPLEGGSNGSGASATSDFAPPAQGDTPQQGSEEKGGGEVATNGAKPALAAGGSVPDSRRSENDAVGRGREERADKVREAEARMREDFCKHGTPSGYPCDDCDIDERFG